MADVDQNLAAEEAKISSLPENDTNIKTLVCHYALYTYHVNRPNCADTPERGGETTVSEFLKKEATANGDFSLSVIASDLSPEEETELRKLLARRISRGTVYAGTGTVASVDLSATVDTEDPYDCYYSLLRQEKPNRHAADSSPDVVCTREYVACFLTNQEGGLELFRTELDKYSENLLPLLDDGLTSLNTTVKTYLQEWYTEAIQYLCRFLKAVDEDVQYIIHAALMGEKDGFIDQEYQENLVKDAHRFYDCCNLFELDHHSAGSKTSDERISLTSSMDSLLVDVSAEINLEKQQPQGTNRQISPEKASKSQSQSSEPPCLTHKATNKFCEEWAKALQEQDTENPVHLKQVVENHKLRVIQDMNHLKRLIRQAEVDHYALFRSFIFLKTSKNGPVLLHHALYGEQAHLSQETENVLTALSQYIEEESAFTR